MNWENGEAYVSVRIHPWEGVYMSRCLRINMPKESNIKLFKTLFKKGKYEILGMIIAQMFVKVYGNSFGGNTNV